MAKRKLYIGNYKIDKINNLVTLPDNVAAERLLLITDVTLNKIIYNFGDPNFGFSAINYDPNSETTFIYLKANLAALGVSDDDKLQIFIDNDYQEVEFSETFIDPVSKIRVSNPENLIDTDFEYGTQSSKWETLQTVNNIPTIYSSNGDVPIEGVTDIFLTKDSKQVKVTTAVPHGLTLGDPITVQGLSEFLAEGSFVINGIGDARTFFYEMDKESNKSGSVNGSYSNIIPSKFFEGSNLQLLEDSGNSIETDSGTISNITVTTQNTHGFSEKTKFYFRNTVGPKELVITDPTALALDGRPTIDIDERLTDTLNVDSTSDTNRSPDLKTPIYSYDWNSTYNLVLQNTAINVVDNTIAWNSHNLQSRYCLLYSDPIKGKTNGGLTDGVVYYVKKIDDNTIQLCTDHETLTNIVDLTTLDTSLGNSRLNLVYKVEQKSGSTKNTPFRVRNITSASTSFDPGSMASNTTVNYKFLIGSVAALGNLTSAVIPSLYLYGYTTSYYIRPRFYYNYYYTTATFIAKNYNGAGTTNLTYQAYGNAQTFSNIDITSCLYVENGNYYIDVQYYTNASSVPSSATPVNLSGISATPNIEYSGSDLSSGVWGLGITAPSKIIAFQLRVPAVGTYNVDDQYSYLTNQREKGRYATSQIAYNYDPTSVASGSFSLSYSETGTVSYGQNSEIFYAFVNINTSFRNTLYYQSHNLSDGDEVTITVPNVSATNSFSFNNSIGDTVNYNLETFNATVSVISDSLIRIQSKTSPFTNDIAQYPSLFTISKDYPNPKYNTIFVANHKITSSAEARFTTVGTPIGGLTNNTTYLLERYNDSRLYVRQTNISDATSALTSAVGNNTTTPTNYDINISTPLGSTPTTATITKLEFRGNFSSADEFVKLVFTDGYTFYAGVTGQDSSVWQEDKTWTSKDISLLLKPITGGTGITVNFTPSSSTIFRGRTPSGMSNRWEIRFTVVGQSGTLIISASGSGIQVFNANNIIGAYDGIYEISAVPSSNSFTLPSAFKIPQKTYEFTQTAIDNVNNTITLTISPEAHHMITGEKVTYDPGVAVPMVNITEGDSLHVIVINDQKIALASSYLDAINNIKIPLAANTGTHTLSTKNLLKTISGKGTVSTTTNSKIITGNGTNFLIDYKRFDNFWVISGGYLKKFTVDKVLTNEKIEVEETISLTESGLTYYYTTQLIPRPDGFSLHKPFDGGIDITSGTSPNCKITRQTRKYFRYQSGKGIQNSFAINFSPAKTVNNISSSGTVATVYTQELHNLNVGEEIIIYNAEVSVGTNYYNGTFFVSEVIDAYTFKYVMGGTPLEQKAAGYPSYARSSWRDSAIRAGMFDDQNGLFYEYDGNTLYAVRRSSTLQLSGYVNTTKGSQIITGLSTNFSTQININDKIVVRGQSYKIVEVSSDNRIVVQPPYRGASATRVKITKTIDTKVPQDKWSIDPCDGTGHTGFILDIHKIQMAYVDYSWYGAGKIRFGFKDQNGHVKYVHEFKHNNRLLESYFRSGNLPGRYEIENFKNPNTAPTLFHFGTSVIMDGRFDNDKAYLFTSASKPFVFTNGSTATFVSNASSQIQQITINGSLAYVYAIPVTEAIALAQTVGSQIRDASNTNIPEGTYITQVKVSGASSLIYLSYPGTSTQPEVATIASGATFTTGEVNPVDLTKPIPLISIRLAPSVDSGVTGAVGERDIINRMQLALKLAGITTNKNLEAYFILNGLPSNMDFVKVQNPSLSEVIFHNSGDIIQKGTTIFSTKVSIGSIDIDLSELTDMGNSILGGDGVFPNGPDILTLAVKPQDTSTISGSSPLFCTGKLTWTESQA